MASDAIQSERQRVVALEETGERIDQPEVPAAVTGVARGVR